MALSSERARNNCNGESPESEPTLYRVGHHDSGRGDGGWAVYGAILRCNQSLLDIWIATWRSARLQIARQYLSLYYILLINNIGMEPVVSRPPVSSSASPPSPPHLPTGNNSLRNFGNPHPFRGGILPRAIGRRVEE
jgi:hypothetical protein